MKKTVKRAYKASAQEVEVYCAHGDDLVDTAVAALKMAKEWGDEVVDIALSSSFTGDISDTTFEVTAYVGLG